MNNEERILELLSESLRGQDQLRNDVDQLNLRVGGLENRFDGLEKRFDRLEKQQATTNLEIKEIRFSIDRLVKYIEHLLPLGQRVEALEKKVFKKS